MADETTTIAVFKKDAAKLKQLLPHLTNDAYRLGELLSNVRIITVSLLPGPADAERPLVVVISNDEVKS